MGLLDGAAWEKENPARTSNWVYSLLRERRPLSTHM